MVEDYCPHCKGTRKTEINASGSEWASLIINGAGSVRPLVCLNCGTVYISRRIIEGLSGQLRVFQKQQRINREVITSLKGGTDDERQ